MHVLICLHAEDTCTVHVYCQGHGCMHVLLGIHVHICCWDMDVYMCVPAVSRVCVYLHACAAGEGVFRWMGHVNGHALAFACLVCWLGIGINSRIPTWWEGWEVVHRSLLCSGFSWLHLLECVASRLGP